MAYKRKTIISGPIKEIIYYYSPKSRKHTGIKQKETKSSVKAYQRRQVQEDIVRMINTNFGQDDAKFEFMLGKDKPGRYDKKIFENNHIKKLARKIRDKARKLDIQFKYYGFIEMGENYDNYHSHFLMNMSDFPKNCFCEYGIRNNRSIIESWWRELGGADNTSSSELQLTINGLKEVGYYFTKEMSMLDKKYDKHEKKYFRSRNLKKPDVNIEELKNDRDVRKVLKNIDEKQVMEKIVNISDDIEEKQHNIDLINMCNEFLEKKANDLRREGYYYLRSSKKKINPYTGAITVHLTAYRADIYTKRKD